MVGNDRPTVIVVVVLGAMLMGVGYTMSIPLMNKYLGLDRPAATLYTQNCTIASRNSNGIGDETTYTSICAQVVDGSIEFFTRNHVLPDTCHNAAEFSNSQYGNTSFEVAREKVVQGQGLFVRGRTLPNTTVVIEYGCGVWNRTVNTTSQENGEFMVLLPIDQSAPKTYPDNVVQVQGPRAYYLKVTAGADKVVWNSAFDVML